MRDEAIRRIMTTSPATVAPGDSLHNARELFESHGIHHLPVVDGDQLVGILSASDLLKLQLFNPANTSLANAKVRHIMRANPVVLPVTASLRDAAEKLRGGEFHALPVIDDAGALVGIVTTSDLIETLLHHVPQGDGSIIDTVSDTSKLAERNRLLEAACQAAEHYIRSGHADREHSILVKRLADLRAAEPVNI